MLILGFKTESMPLPRPRVCRGRTYYPGRYDAWRKAVALEARAMLRVRKAEIPAYPKGLRVAFRLYLPEKRSNSDASNHLKAWEDALEGLLYDNDSQIVELHCEILGWKPWPPAWSLNETVFDPKAIVQVDAV